ncbi:hypothetical protein EDD22DRAFT_268103 [Suillus occidentalis]|nr:hypothetical protein EDD22DRAFT_268103 [Suillus occidentalis]
MHRQILIRPRNTSLLRNLHMGLIGYCSTPVSIGFKIHTHVYTISRLGLRAYPKSQISRSNASLGLYGVRKMMEAGFTPYIQAFLPFLYPALKAHEATHLHAALPLFSPLTLLPSTSRALLLTLLTPRTSTFPSGTRSLLTSHSLPPLLTLFLLQGNGSFALPARTLRMTQSQGHAHHRLRCPSCVLLAH